MDMMYCLREELVETEGKGYISKTDCHFSIAF
jgi:hypothetical protein